MKKIFTISMAILFSSFSIIAAPHLQVKKLAKAAGDSAVSIYYAAEDNKGIIEIIWQGDSTISPAYDVQIGRLDTATYNYALITDLASYSSNFAIDGFDGYFSISSDLVMKNGDNYSTIGSQGASASTIAKWQAAWEASVNEADFTLKPGFYVIFVEGVDLNFDTTEAYDYAIVEIPGAQGINETESEKKELAKKIYLNGRLLIIRNETIYDVHGRRVK